MEITFDHLLYRRGFILSQLPVNPPKPDWNSLRIGNYFFSYDPENSFTFLKREESWISIMGRCIDTLYWNDNIEIIADNCLQKLEKSENEFLDYIDNLSGRFIIVYHRHGCTCMMNDAFGTRSVFYTIKGPVIVASHCMIIRNILNSKESEIMTSIINDPYWNESKHYGYPGNLTPYEDIYLLTPNTLLKLEEKRIQRFYPRKDLQPHKLDDVIHGIATNLTSQIELLNKNNRLAISLSAGFDSRLTLSATRNIRNNVLCFTYGSPPNNRQRALEIDMAIASDITSKMQVKHIRFRNTTQLTEEEMKSFYRVMEINTYWKHFWWAACMYMEQLPPGMLHIRSNLVGAIGRAYYRKRGFKSLPLTPEKMTYLWKNQINNYKPVIQIFERFSEATSFNTISNYDPYDLFYWEHRMSAWHSLVLLEDDAAFDTFIIYNCRRLVEKMLSVPLVVRMNSKIHTELIKQMWPELLNWPVNPKYFSVTGNYETADLGIHVGKSLNGLRNPFHSSLVKRVGIILLPVYKLMKKIPLTFRKRIRHIINRNMAISVLYKKIITAVRSADQEAKLKNFSSNRKMAEIVNTKNRFILREIKRRINDIRSSNKKRAYPSARKDLNMAVIMDEFTFDCFKYEANLITFTPDNWKQVLIQKNPDLLFVESAWQGNGSTWRGQITGLKEKSSSRLPELINWCRANNIPTVFWNKEDPAHYTDFLDAAQLFDYVFTTDSNCIENYKKDLQHDRIFCLPFAAQPRIHNPIGSAIKIRNIAFAGSWYEGITKERNNRKNQMAYIVEPSLDYDTDIFDRHYLLDDPRYRFPEQYQSHILGSIDYKDMIYAYRMYKIFLNVSSVADSPTMLPRRVLEIIACGTCVLSGESTGIRNMLDTDIVKLSSSTEETKSYLELLLKDEELRRRSTIVGLRKIMAEHTYEERLDYLLQILNIHKTGNKKSNIGVSIITATNKSDYFENILANYEQQIYGEKELIIILNSNNLNSDEWSKKAKKYKNVSVYQVDETEGLGTCLNFGVSKARFEYIAKFDDDDYYAPHYLVDMVNAFIYSDADIVGKKSIYAFMEGSRTLTCRNPGLEYCYVDSVSGATIIARRHLFHRIKFRDGKGHGKDTKFLDDCIKAGLIIFASDRYNYCQIRTDTIGAHTWKIDDEYLINTGEIITSTDDYISHVTC